MLAMLVILVAAAGSVMAGQAVNESRPVPAGAEVSVENIAGSVKIDGWSSSSVQVTGTLGHGVEELKFSVDEEDGEVSIEVEYDEDYHGRHDEPTDLFINMPASSPVSVETVSASITVSGIDGSVDIETVSGKVDISGRPEALEIESVSGGVQVETAPSGTGIESVSGRIEIASAAGELEVENVSGTILVNGGRLGDADFETVSGNIECYALAGDGDVDMETMSGTITLTVNPDAVAYYELSTFSGSIKNDFGPEPKRTSKYTPGKELSFNTGSGGPSISLTSFSGTIKLMVR
jgi:DUF4097 and DUF4098 domain-containing protein YvlB